MTPYLREINAAASRDVARILQQADARAALQLPPKKPRFLGLAVVISFPLGLVLGFLASWYFIG